VVERPVKVIEKQVKVVEREVQVIEKPVKVMQKPARSASTAETSDRPSETGTFQDTGLPTQLSYQGKLWNAADRVKGLPTDLLAADRRRVDGRIVYHDADAEAPYPHVYLKVAGQTDQYVRSIPTSS
jgi:hypothetical protein